MPLRIVYVTDIHFRHDAWDEDADQRRELIDDVKGRLIDLGPVDAVLVGGDVAFSGKPHEYEIARKWLADLVAACCGIDESRVFTVPGNHDVDLSVVQQSYVAQELRTALSTCEVAAINHELHERVGQDPAASGLFLPLEAYNNFAQRYLCPTTPEHPHWEDTTTFDVDGWPVCLTGQNSVLISDRQDGKFEDETGRHRLILGSHQCRLTRDGQPIHIVMAHHPPSWIRDWAVVQPLMRRAHVWLYGHEHAYRSEQQVAMGSVQLSAGAVGPERDQRGEQAPWIPAYTILTLARTEYETLRATVEPRSWSLEHTRFVAHDPVTEVFEIARDPAVSSYPDPAPPSSGSRVADSPPTNGLPAASTSRTDTPTDARSDASVSDNVDPDITTPTAGQASPLAESIPNHMGREGTSAVSRPDLRRYATQFMSLPLSDRITIGQRLDVLDEADLAAGDAPDAYRVILRRINERQLVPALVKELENRLAR